MTKKKILLVEDQKFNRCVISAILEKEFDVIETQNGAEALAVLEKPTPVDIILTDIQMPVMDGFQLLKKLGQGRFSNIPVIAMTGTSGTEIEERALGSGAWDFVAWPIREKVLLSRLYNVIARGKVNQAEHVKYLYEHDRLTGLYNRTALFRNIREMMERLPEEKFVFCRFDIDRFHLYNTAMGEEEGNRLLCYLADLGRKVTKNVPNCIYGHLDSDVFCIFVPYRPEQFTDKIQYIVDRLRAYRSDYLLEPSFGVYVLPDHEVSVETMLTKAFLAAGKCKNQYMTYVGLYDQSMDEQAAQEQEIINEMQTALENEQFVVYLQPKYNLRNDMPCGAEALVRWQHPRKGLVSPGVFIPVFENNGFIAKLDYYMWEHVCALLKKWKTSGRRMYPVSVNMSRISLYNPNVAFLLQNLVNKYGIEPELLNLEVTESAYMSNPELMKQSVSQLQEAGFVIMMDDFGSGYSSLNMLKEINIDILKIDMKFLPTGHENVNSEKILASVLRMANWLGIPAIVEGVETLTQRDFLKSIGCMFVQGFFYARPLPVEKYEQLMEQADGEDWRSYSKEHPTHEADSIWSFSSENNLLLQGVSLPFAVFEYADNFFEVIRKNEAFINEFEYDERSYESHLPLNEMQKLQRISQEAVAGQSFSEGECFFSFDKGQNRWYRVRMQYLKTIRTSQILCGIFVEVTKERGYEKEVNHLINLLHPEEKPRTKMLIVDDDEAERSALALNFQNQYEILEAQEGEQALSLLRANKDTIRIILLDLLMPKMGGEEFLEYKNRMQDVAGIPVVVVSSRQDAGTQINMLRNGVNDYVVKPFVPEIVKKRVQNVLEYNSRFRELVKEYREQWKMPLRPKQSSQEEGNVFSVKEMIRYIDFLTHSFDVVRMVEPRDTAVLSFDEDENLITSKYACFRVWNKDVRCTNCSSICAQQEDCKKTKYEFIENNIFYVISRPVHVILKDQTILDCVLEIVSHVSDHLLMQRVGNKTMKELLEETQMKIYTDELTKIYNRRYFDEMLFAYRGQNSMAKRIAFIMTDINKFKFINDRYGHYMGDQVLIQVASSLKSCLGRRDTVLRYGGDEFLIILTDCEEEDILEMIQVLKKKVRGCRFMNGPELRLRISCGYAYTKNFEAKEEVLLELVKEADDRMYADKRSALI